MTKSKAKNRCWSAQAWWPGCPWPEDVWTCSIEDVGTRLRDKIDDNDITAISGVLMRHGWRMAEKEIIERLVEAGVVPPNADMVEHWLYIWKEHHYLPGRPAEYSNPPVILKVPGLMEALEEARTLTANSPKWEMYEGSGWSGKATVAAGHTPIKPLNVRARSSERVRRHKDDSRLYHFALCRFCGCFIADERAPTKKPRHKTCANCAV